jgi:hypothetical protein
MAAKKKVTKRAPKRRPRSYSPKRSRPSKQQTSEKAHASPPTVFDDGKGCPPDHAVPWKMWPKGKPAQPRVFHHQSWYGARALAAEHFGVHRDLIDWEKQDES